MEVKSIVEIKLVCSIKNVPFTVSAPIENIKMPNVYFGRYYNQLPEYVRTVLRDLVTEDNVNLCFFANEIEKLRKLQNVWLTDVALCCSTTNDGGVHTCRYDEHNSGCTMYALLRVIVKCEWNSCGEFLCIGFCIRKQCGVYMEIGTAVPDLRKMRLAAKNVVHKYVIHSSELELHVVRATKMARYKSVRFGKYPACIRKYVEQFESFVCSSTTDIHIRHILNNVNLGCILLADVGCTVDTWIAKLVDFAHEGQYCVGFSPNPHTRHFVLHQQTQPPVDDDDSDETLTDSDCTVAY